MGKSENILLEVSEIIQVLRLAKSQGYVSKRYLGERLGFDISKTKDSSRLQTRITRAKKELLLNGEIVVNVPKKGYKITKDQALIFAESAKALGRSIGSFIVHGKLYSTINGIIALQLDLEGLSGHLDWARATAKELKEKDRLLKVFAHVNEIDLSDKPEYVQEEINAISELDEELFIKESEKKKKDASQDFY